MTDDDLFAGIDDLEREREERSSSGDEGPGRLARLARWVRGRLPIMVRS